MSDMTLLKILRDAKLPFNGNGFQPAFRDWAAERTSFFEEVAEAALAHAVASKVEVTYRWTNYLDKRRQPVREWSGFASGVTRLSRDTPLTRHCRRDPRGGRVDWKFDAAWPGHEAENEASAGATKDTLFSMDTDEAPKQAWPSAASHDILDPPLVMRLLD